MAAGVEALRCGDYIVGDIKMKRIHILSQADHSILSSFATGTSSEIYVGSDPFGRILASDKEDGCIMVFSGSGEKVGCWGAKGFGKGMLQRPYQMSFDAVAGFGKPATSIHRW